MSEPITAVLLAAGQSSRMGATNKLLLEVDGLPLVRLSAMRLLRAPISKLLVVTGFAAHQIQDCLQDLPLTTLHNRDWENGMGSSLAVAAQACPNGTNLCVCVADLPYLQHATICQLCTIFVERGAQQPVQPTYQGRPGHPVLLPASLLPAIRELEGDRGARDLLAQENTLRVEAKDPGILMDWDKSEDITAKI